LNAHQIAQYCASLKGLVLSNEFSISEGYTVNNFMYVVLVVVALFFLFKMFFPSKY